ncbi:ribosome-binding factor PSRP1, chloroplastic-like [Populus trichocarpa]|uniref:ribosome-binding factor PSRP1, chloroplastic-like n=1 Tax=Populus trichocarpa TaxID=3694 RepID=UPI000D187D43|nr:ribosome-binding factor PSRP1, chloroplastic-like [Populus trichocarpa]|eukprot:XP_024438359.1 ribosome-binding factor PSRP1, chloroplastic-like [Populus trichocarpa]
MKGFNKLKVREPMSQVVENDADTVSQRKDDDNLDEAVHTKYFDMPPLTVHEAIVRLGNVDHAMPSMVSGMLKGQDTEFEIK